MVLHDGSVETFRREAFAYSHPAMMPKNYFLGFPAIKKWFIKPGVNSSPERLNGSYLKQLDETWVPVESTRRSSRNASSPESSSAEFERINCPFRMFRLWTENTKPESEIHLYLAQLPISTLPESLRDDLPTPQVVTKAGKGDVYDANIWIGLSPTYTPLHRDPNSNLLIQLAGCKIVRLLSPGFGSETFNRVQASMGRQGSANLRGEEMMMGEERVLFDDLIWNGKSTLKDLVFSGFEAHLKTGDAVFIPKGWWHSVKSTGEGIAASVGYDDKHFMNVNH